MVEPDKYHSLREKKTEATPVKIKAIRQILTRKTRKRDKGAKNSTDHRTLKPEEQRQGRSQVATRTRFLSQELIESQPI